MANSGAEVIAPISITEAKATNFGIILATGSVGTVTLLNLSFGGDPRSSTGGIELVSGGGEQIGVFTIGGEPLTTNSRPRPNRTFIDISHNIHYAIPYVMHWRSRTQVSAVPIRALPAEICPTISARLPRFAGTACFNSSFRLFNLL